MNEQRITRIIESRIEEEMDGFDRLQGVLDQLEAKEVALFIRAARSGELMDDYELQAFCRHYAHPCLSDGPYAGPGAETFVDWLRQISNLESAPRPRREAALRTLGYLTGEGVRHRWLDHLAGRR